MRYIPNPKWPTSLNNLIMQDNKQRVADFSVTELIQPPQLLALRRRHDDKIVEPVEDGIWKILGKLLHKRMDEAAGPNALTEERLTAKIQVGDTPDQCATISGMPDHYDETDAGTIYDYKVTSVFAVKDAMTENGKREWEEQLNCYAYLLRHHGFNVSKLKIVAICRDWRNSEAQRDESYPKQVEIIEVPLWVPVAQLEFIHDRLALHIDATYIADDKLPKCTDEEMWASPQKWAVMKEGAVKAAKLHDTEEAALADAHERGAKFFVEERPRQYKRCESYCPVSAFCQQLNKNKSIDRKLDEAGL